MLEKNLDKSKVINQGKTNEEMVPLNVVISIRNELKKVKLSNKNLTKWNNEKITLYERLLGDCLYTLRGIPDQKVSGGQILPKDNGTTLELATKIEQTLKYIENQNIIFKNT